MQRDRHLARSSQIYFSFLSRRASAPLPYVMSSRIPVGILSSASAPSIAVQPGPDDGTYGNPILHADYSDPDAIRVGNDFWLVSSSFSHVPGLPLLHSKDLVNWTLVGHALPRLVPEEVFATPQHGKGVWAPSIRHRAGLFWIYYGDPDFGLFLVTAIDPRGPWSKPVLVKSCRGLIDPCPFWEDDGAVYLIHGWAKSRAGFANVLTLLKLTEDGLGVAEDLGVVIDGDQLSGYRTLEGPKIYKRDDWYYVFAPAGGVETGWQSVFRSRSIQGPYASRIVLAQGRTAINGPHQGALVDLNDGASWFLHFQDKGAYGRVVHLQPVTWSEGWPSIGVNQNDDGCGEPALRYARPAIRPSTGLPPAPLMSGDSQDFLSATLALQWQWQANPKPGWHSLVARPGWLRLFAQPVTSGNFHTAPHLLLQKFPSLEFTVDTLLEITSGSAGLIVFGQDYAWIGVSEGKLVRVTACDAHRQPLIRQWRGRRIRRLQLFPGAAAGRSYDLIRETIGNSRLRSSDVWRARLGSDCLSPRFQFSAAPPFLQAELIPFVLSVHSCDVLH
jgi:beta-xylosidase